MGCGLWFMVVVLQGATCSSLREQERKQKNYGGRRTVATCCSPTSVAC